MTELKLPKSSGLDLLQRVHDQHGEVAVIVLTQYGAIDSAVAATRLEAHDYVTKPFRVDELRSRLERVESCPVTAEAFEAEAAKLNLWMAVTASIAARTKYPALRHADSRNNTVPP